MPGRGIMRAKQLRGGSLGQGTRFYYLGANKAPISKVAGAQGFGKTNPSIGSMKSLGIMKQNRKAGGNNICKETQMTSYYTQKFQIKSPSLVIPKGTMIYKNGSTQLLAVAIDTSKGGVVEARVSMPLFYTHHTSVTLVTPNVGFPGIPGTIIGVTPPAVKVSEKASSSCGCNGPKGYCPNCSGRANPSNAITGGAGFSSTNSFTLLSH